MVKKHRSRILYLSRTPLTNTSGATLAMRRHLLEHKDFDTFVITSEVHNSSDTKGLQLKPSKLLQRIRNTRLNRFIHNLELVVQPSLFDSRIDTAAQSFKPNAIFTVADLTLSDVALQIARQLRLPLVVNFQDWWPRGQFYTQNEVPFRPLVPILERRFRNLYQRADLAFCTSEGMRDFLGSHPNSHVLYPIGDGSPCTAKTDRPTQDPGKKRQLIYTGTAFGSYGRMLLQLAEALQDHPNWQLVIYGKRPDWPVHTLAAAEQSGLYRGFLPFEQLRAVLASADACLSVMSFDPEFEAMMRTSFTTKILDYCNARSPILMWGPSFCSPIRLIQKHQAGLTITTPDPAGVLHCLQRLDREADLSESLAHSAQLLAEGELAHTNIHSVFVREINRVIAHW